MQDPHKPVLDIKAGRNFTDATASGSSSVVASATDRSGGTRRRKSLDGGSVLLYLISRSGSYLLEMVIDHTIIFRNTGHTVYILIMSACNVTLDEEKLVQEIRSCSYCCYTNLELVGGASL